jgi:hypothetical protein
MTRWLNVAAESEPIEPSRLPTIGIATATTHPCRAGLPGRNGWSGRLSAEPEDRSGSAEPGWTSGRAASLG